MSFEFDAHQVYPDSSALGELWSLKYLFHAFVAGSHLDASDDDMLLSADVERCRGVFAVSGDDSKNLVISLSAVSSIRRCASSRECTIHAMPRKPDVPVPTRVGEGGRRRRRVETIFPG
jgi:hypothetical protein